MLRVFCLYLSETMIYSGLSATKEEPVGTFVYMFAHALTAIYIAHI